MKTFAVVLLAVLFQSAAAAEEISDGQLRYERYLVEGTEASVMLHTACAVKSHAEGKRPEIECTGCIDCSVGTLAISRTPEAAQALVNLLSIFVSDVGLAESRHCMILIRGKPLLPLLRKLNPAQARKHCAALLDKVSVGSYPDISKVTPEQVCTSEDTIRFWRDKSISDIEAGKQCEPWNID